ncbi:hypothetical protein AALP_AAs44809U000200 [Arabis alpina]|uniref:KIB1-4 beta-propeller domain-containing protein n=1 Tax=Arabis alpina TaxID=50452 RepID=A0A087G2V5_ARAAL|nr:hypothetical protein AALP_AAs44809U000200 [Arabis alpina]
MSQLLVRIAKISSSSMVKKHGLCFSELRSLSTAATPYLLFDHTDQDEMTLSCEPLVELNVYDPRKEETVKIPDQTLTKELLRSRKVGSSRGWMVGKLEESLTKEEFKALHPKEPPYQYFFTKKLKGFVVFRQDPEQRIASYTEDIGDLCIFLGDNEAFCVSATEYPGLKPNSVYFAKYDRGFGFYDLSSNTVHDVIDRPPFSCCNYWLAPLE